MVAVRSSLVWLPLLSSMVFHITGCPLAEPSESTPTTPTPPERVTFDDGFEKGLVNWVQDADLPNDPVKPSQPIAASVELSTEQAFEGVRSAKFSMDAVEGDGTLWLEHQFSLLPHQNYRVTLRLALWSNAEAAVTPAQVAAIATNERPRREDDFNTAQAANLTIGWKQYAYQFDLTTDATGRIWTAIGINAAQNGPLLNFIDDVHISLDPR